MSVTLSAPVPSPARAPRTPEAPVHPQFVQRWSSRAFSSDPIDSETLRTLFEAARWAPSASNAQPWLFVYADEPEALERFRDLVKPSNRRWADQAPVLLFLFSRRENKGEPNRCAQFDSGAAWMSFALEANRLGLVTRAMGGIHHDRIHEALSVPRDQYEICCAIALGRRGRLEDLHPDLHEREWPSERRPLAEIARRGGYQPSSS
ncbi:MAG TPA: nitroreductase family protein [Polyangiaceae bacterium]|nr:nitroreductase family protein [Polyangiaceae bacterium]